jgi:deoxyribonuclease-4
MAGLLFGTAGIPLSTWPQTTTDGIKRVAYLGLDCMELEFVQGVYLNEADARLVAGAAADYGIRLSAHAPYFINLNAHEPRKLRASQGILLKAARIAQICGVGSIVFHAGFYLGDPPPEVYQTVKKYLGEVVEKLRQEGNRIWLRPEVSGKASQFGTVEELVNLCAEMEGLAPCLDFAHWHAHTMSVNSYPEFASVLEQIKDKLGQAALDDMHIHISGIAYGERGEKRHLALNESDLQYKELLKALKDYSTSGMVICESPNLEEDALLLQKSYNALP